MNDGLKPEHRQAIIDTLASNPSVERIVLFGSRAMGTFTPTSDVDLVLFGDDLTLSDQAALAEAVAELPIAQRVDILIYHRIEHEALRAHIRKHGVEWFARKTSAARGAGMGGEWRTIPFSEAVVLNPPVALERGIRYPFIDMTAVSPASRWAYATEEREFSGGGSRFQHGDTLMARITPCLENGKIARFFAPQGSDVGHGSTEFIVVRGRSGVTDSEFVYYLTRWEEFRNYAIGQMTGTSGRQRVPADSLSHLDVPIPPLPEQRAIAHILGTLDDKIELNRRMSETLEQMARALFKAWFVDFEPVRAKMEGRWRRGESLPGLPAHLYDLFPDRLVDSELGEIPEGWEVRTIGDHVQCVKGKSYKSEDLRESDVALVTLKSFARGGGYRPDGLKAYAGNYKLDQIVLPGELIIACTDVTQAAEVIGKPALVQPDDQFKTLVASLDVLIVKPKDEAVTIPFLYCLFRTDEFSDHTYAHSSGTTVLHLAPDAVPSFQFKLPPRGMLSIFSRIAEQLFQRVSETQRQSRTLASLRDALLPKLISGELRVKDAERFLKDRGL